MKIVTVQQMRSLEQRSEAQGVSVDSLMERAGREVARVAAGLLSPVRGARVLVLVGPGNNGGDSLVAARHLHDEGARVTLYLATPTAGAPTKYELCMDRGIPAVEGERDADHHTLQDHLNNAHLVIDAVLGTGTARPLTGVLKSVFATLNQGKQQRPDMPLLALDLPTGLNADTGEADPACPYADVTVTLGAPKRGLFTFPGALHVGRLEIVDIGVPHGLDEEVDLELLTPELVRGLLPPRPLSAHKGTFGRVLVVAGSRNYVGATSLACSGSYRAGAGLVTLATPQSVYRIIAASLTEATYLPLPESEEGTIRPQAAEQIHTALANYDVLLFGCGLGQNEATEELTQHLLLREPPLKLPVVIDADGLNNLARLHRWWERLTPRAAILTPHPGEMSRLLSRPSSAVLEDRIGTAGEAACLWNQTVVLKGAFTFIASPEGGARLSPFANPGLATAGTGDVLAGIIAGLLAQGLSPYNAASCGVYLHAAAGERVRHELGETGMVAGDLLPQMPKVIQALKGHH